MLTFVLSCLLSFIALHHIKLHHASHHFTTMTSQRNATHRTSVKVSDPYGWMRDESRLEEDVLNHLKNENSYTEKLTSHLDTLRTEIYNEMIAGIKETDYTVPSKRKDGYLYYTRTYEGKSYPTYCRAPYIDNWKDTIETNWNGLADSPILPNEITYLDVNELIQGHTYCAVGSVKVSSTNPNLVAYTVDFTGNEVTQIYVKNIETGQILDHNPNLDCYGLLTWGNDDKTLFYMKLDEQKRPYQLYRRTIGSDEDDELLYQEDDELFWLHFSKSFDGKYLFVTSASKETTEVQYLDLYDDDDSNSNSNSNKLQCVAKRRSKVIYKVTHRDGYWYIQSNVGSKPNLRLMVSPAVPDSEELWKDIVVDSTNAILFDGGYDRSIDWITHFTNHSVANGRENGLPQIWFISYKGGEGEEESSSSSSSPPVVENFIQLEFDEDAYDVGLGTNYECTADSVVVSYDSLITPLSHISIPLNNPTDLDARTILKTKEVPGYNKNEYGCERTTVKSRDGNTDIPISIVYRKDVMDKVIKNGETVPTHLYGYGSYSACMEASFRTTRRALLDRGMVYVIANVRGGGEMGRQWYEEPNGAKYLCKKNTFNDFVDVARWLTTDDGENDGENRKKITTPSSLSCEGRSAGGLLIGASINQEPELFKAALLGVPFVDVVPTMIDASIPLTVVEWAEWGNPNEEKYHQYMMDYSPINNVQPGKTYPSCLLTGGLHDPRVQYWEPAKFAAEIRHQSNPTESGPCCIKIDMDAGHFSASDRYKYLRELAFDYAFLLDQLGLVVK